VLTIHRSERADALVDALVRVVDRPLDDPFTPEVVAVPTRGVERWLTHRLSAVLGASPGRADGVCANVEFPFPGRLVGDVLAEATGVDRHEDPWRAERLVWPVLEVLDACIGEAWCDLLTAHLGRGDDDPGDGRPGDDDLRRTRRFATARHVADLFDTYGVQRPAMVLDWLAGGHGDGAGGQLPEDARWQAELLRRVRGHVGTAGPPERVADACTRLRAGTLDVDLPARVSLFGLTRLPATYLDVLRALAVRREVHLFALHPSLVLWDRMAASGVPALPLPRAEDPTRDVPSHPLLRTWARDTREMQLVLAEAADADSAHHPVAGGEPATLLERIQADVRADTEPPGAPLPGAPDQRMAVAGDDRSLQVHACHGRARQVEVLRDAICHLLLDDPGLEPRDVIVLCPDIDEFAPLLHATFGAAGALDDAVASDRGVPALPYRLADRSLRQTNPLLGALADLLHLLDSRLTAPDVVDFAGREPVRSRFALDDRALERIAGWIAASGIRWGLDADRRAGWWLAGVEANTWRTGLDRLLLGVTMDEDGSRLVGGRLPLDDVDSGDVDLAGRFAELVARIDSVATRAAADQPVAAWSALLGDATDLLLDTTGDAAWQRVQVDRVLREVVAEATAGGTPADTLLSLAEVRALLADRLRGVPTRADFRTGAITMCTLVPMRAVPHRVVCVLGLDDGAFPRTGGADGDDLLRRVPMVGDRDPRAEDRQLLLDAVLAAQQHLVITYTGRDERTNEPRPPAVPLSELLDVVHRTARTADGRSGRDHVIREHPLQPFDPRSFAADGGDGRRWGFDRVALAGARAMCTPRRPAAPFLDAPLPPDDPAVVSVDDLVRFVQHPIREFLRQRLGLNVWEDDDELDADIPVELDGLQAWAVGNRMLERVLAGDPLDDAVAAELARGALPPGAMGVAAVDDIRRTVEKIHAIAGSTGVAGPSTSLEIDVDCGPVLLAGTVAGIRADVVGAVSYSSIAPKHRLAAWVRLLAVSAAHPDAAWRAVTIGRRSGSGRVVEHRALDDPPSARAQRARALLGELLDLRRRGMQAPLPLPCATAEAWASRSRSGKDARAAARDCWETTFRFDKEDLDRSHRRVFGGVAPFDRLLDELPAGDEAGDGWAADEATRFGRLARRLWDPLLDHEVWR
jgi:exodeoxyribonuclease V gamma subunit